MLNKCLFHLETSHYTSIEEDRRGNCEIAKTSISMAAKETFKNLTSKLSLPKSIKQFQRHK